MFFHLAEMIEMLDGTMGLGDASIMVQKKIRGKYRSERTREGDIIGNGRNIGVLANELAGNSSNRPFHHVIA